MIGCDFNSQTCTTVEQSKRLLGLGLKKETADMQLVYSDSFKDGVLILPYPPDEEGDIPAWSLHRLIEMTSDFCDVDGEEGVWCCECRDLLGYRSVMTESWLIMWNKPSLYDNIIDCIEWLIKNEEFSNEYIA